MTDDQPKNKLHGITLKAIVEDLVARRGWPGLAAEINVRCFSVDPSVQSSLKFLRRTAWARKQVEGLYLADQRAIKRSAARDQRPQAIAAPRGLSDRDSRRSRNVQKSGAQ